MPTDNRLGYQAVCAIIRTGYQAGVRKLSYGDLQVEFGSSPGLSYHPDLPPEPTDPRVSGTPSTTPMQTLMTDDQKSHLRELELSHMMMSDPQGYENMMIDELMLSERSVDEAT